MILSSQYMRRLNLPRFVKSGTGCFILLFCEASHKCSARKPDYSFRCGVLPWIILRRFFTKSTSSSRPYCEASELEEAMRPREPPQPVRHSSVVLWVL